MLPRFQRSACNAPSQTRRFGDERSEASIGNHQAMEPILLVLDPGHQPAESSRCLLSLTLTLPTNRPILLLSRKLLPSSPAPRSRPGQAASCLARQGLPPARLSANTATIKSCFPPSRPFHWHGALIQTANCLFRVVLDLRIRASQTICEAGVILQTPTFPCMRHATAASRISCSSCVEVSRIRIKPDLVMV